MPPTELRSKLDRLKAILSELGSVLVAYSGGVDSSLLLKVAHMQLGARAIGVTAVSPTFPAIELEEALRIAAEIGARHEIVHTNQLEIPSFVINDATRCFHCKSDLYQLLRARQPSNIAAHIVDGTHRDDLGDDRPGIAAARKWGVLSPLVDAGLTKADVRNLARELGLSNWDKPAAACLASRIPRGTPITIEKLTRVERAEAVLRQEGLRHVRIRDHGELARIEVSPPDIPTLLDPERREKIVAAIKKTGFVFVTLDLEGYRAGGVGLSPLRSCSPH
ncbi:MAG: ATP-dependent sacrificial sulfur transferase LarE [Nitrospira sp.]|nr:ATP-dependent sacrificial sulfur transferase LarE [Nitrospira sp.]MCP9463972.1 ATP-dependent sacrificial sulfur transferase LarE [Nitrospira sp.]